MKRISISVAGGLFLAASVFTFVSAQTNDRRGAQPFAPQPYVAAGQTVCVPWCPNDESPCDPPYFKQADRRCGRPFEINR